MESSLKRRDPMQQQQPPQTDSDAENNISGGDRLISPCKRLRLHDTPDKTVTFADQTNRQDTPGAPRRCGSADDTTPVKPIPDQNSPDTSVTPATNAREKSERSTNFASENSQLSGNTQEDSEAPTDEARVEDAPCCSPDASPVQSPVVTPEKSLAFGAEEDQEDVDGHDSPGTPQHRIPNNTPEKSDDLDDHSDVDDIFVNGAASEESEHYVFNPTSGNSVTFADRTNVNGVHFEEDTSRLPGRSCSERSVTFADQTNTNGAHRRTDPPHRSMNSSVLKKERDQEPFPSEHADSPITQLCSEPFGLVPFSESLAGPPNLQRRLRFNSAGNLLCPEELDHHRLSLQSYGSLAQFGSHGRHRHRRVCSSGSSYLDAQQAPYEDAPAAVAAAQLVPQGSHRRHFTASGSEGSLLRPQNLDHRFIQAQQLAGPNQGRLVDYGSVDGPGRLVDYGSIDDLQGQTRHHGDQGGLVGYGSVDILAGFPRQARDCGQSGHGHYGGVDAWAKEPQHRDSTQGRLWYYGSIDDPRRLTSSLQSVHPASQRGQVFEGSQHHAGGTSKGQSNLVRQRSEQTFVRSASRRTLPRLSSQGTEGKLGRSASHGSMRHHGHQEPAGRVGYSGSHQSAPHQNQQHDFVADKSGHPGYTNHPGGAKNSRGSLCVLTNSGNQGSVVHGHDRPGPVAHPAVANNGYHTHHQAGTAGLFGSSGSHADLHFHGNTGQLGVFKHSDLHADAQRIRSGSAGSTDSRGRSAGSQRSVESQGRSVGSQRSVESQGRSVGSQRSSESQGRSVGSQRSSESQGRSVGSQRSVESQGRSVGSQRSSESHGREVGTGSQQSVDSRGNPRASLRPEEAYPADSALAEASKKRKVLETPGMVSVSVCFCLSFIVCSFSV